MTTPMPPERDLPAMAFSVPCTPPAATAALFADDIAGLLSVYRV